MYRFIRASAAALAVCLLLAVPAANARPIDGPGTPRPAEPVPGLPTWPLDPQPIVRTQQPPVVVEDSGSSPLTYIIPTAAIALMIGAAVMYAAGPRRPRAA